MRLLQGISPESSFPFRFPMNSFSLPLLRDAGRLDLWCSDHRRRIPADKNTYPFRRRQVTLAVAGGHHAGLSQIRSAWEELSRAGRDARSLASLLRILAVAASSEASGGPRAPGMGWSGDLQPWISDRA